MHPMHALDRCNIRAANTAAHPAGTPHPSLSQSIPLRPSIFAWAVAGKQRLHDAHARAPSLSGCCVQGSLTGATMWSCACNAIPTCRSCCVLATVAATLSRAGAACRRTSAGSNHLVVEGLWALWCPVSHFLSAPQRCLRVSPNGV